MTGKAVGGNHLDPVIDVVILFICSAIDEVLAKGENFLEGFLLEEHR